MEDRKEPYFNDLQKMLDEIQKATLYGICNDYLTEEQTRHLSTACEIIRCVLERR